MRKRRIGTVLAALSIPLAFGAGLAGLVYLKLRQAEKDSALIAAVVRNDVPAALRLLDSGADPNARDRRKALTTGWRDLLMQCLGRAHAPAGPAALQLAMEDPDRPYDDHSSDYTMA